MKLTEAQVELVRDTANEMDQLFRQKHNMAEVESLLKRMLRESNELAQVRAQPVAWIDQYGAAMFHASKGHNSTLPSGTQLYLAAPQPAPGMVSVPVEPTEEMVNAPRYFILYCETPGRTYKDCRRHLELAGVEIDSWPEWAKTAEGHITKGAVAAIAWAMMLSAAQGRTP